MPDHPSASRRAVLATVLALAVLASGSAAARPLGGDSNAPHDGELAACAGTVVPRPSAGASLSGAPYLGVYRQAICFASVELTEAQRIELRLIVGPTFFGEAHATFGEASVGGVFAGGQLISGRATALSEVASGPYTLTLMAGYRADVGQGGQQLRPLCVPPIEDPGCAIAVPVPFVSAGAGPLGAVGSLGAQVRKSS